MVGGPWLPPCSCAQDGKRPGVSTVCLVVRIAVASGFAGGSIFSTCRASGKPKAIHSYLLAMCLTASSMFRIRSRCSSALRRR